MCIDIKNRVKELINKKINNEETKNRFLELLNYKKSLLNKIEDKELSLTLKDNITHSEANFLCRAIEQVISEKNLQKNADSNARFLGGCIGFAVFAAGETTLFWSFPPFLIMLGISGLLTLPISPVAIAFMPSLAPVLGLAFFGIIIAACLISFESRPIIKQAQSKLLSSSFGFFQLFESNAEREPNDSESKVLEDRILQLIQTPN